MDSLWFIGGMVAIWLGGSLFALQMFRFGKWYDEEWDRLGGEDLAGDERQKLIDQAKLPKGPNS